MYMYMYIELGILAWNSSKIIFALEICFTICPLLLWWEAICTCTCTQASTGQLCGHTFMTSISVKVWCQSTKCLCVVSFHTHACHGQGEVRENSILFKIKEKSGGFLSGQGIRESGNFILRLPQIIFNLDFFRTCTPVWTREFCFNNYLSHPYFYWFMVRIIILHNQWKLFNSQWKVRDFFLQVGGNPDNFMILNGNSQPPSLSIN